MKPKYKDDSKVVEVNGTPFKLTFHVDYRDGTEWVTMIGGEWRERTFADRPPRRYAYFKTHFTSKFSNETHALRQAEKFTA